MHLLLQFNLLGGIFYTTIPSEKFAIIPIERKVICAIYSEEK